MKPQARKEAMVTGSNYRFTVLTDRLIRMEYQKDGLFVDEPTQTVICRDFPVPEYRVIDKEDILEIVTENLHLYYDKKEFSSEGLRIELKRAYHIHGSKWNYGDKIEDLKGTARTLDMVDGAVELESGILSRNGFTVLDDSKTAFITEDMWSEPKNRESMDLYFWGYGHDYIECLKDFYHLCGETPLLPRFTLGNWWSRYFKYTEESYLKLMDKFEEKEIPLSTAVIDMDWHLVDIPEKYGSGWTGYTWNPEFFPNPKRFLSALHDRGMHTTINVHPADGVRAHEEAYLEMAKELGVDYEKEDRISFDIADKKFVDAYFKYLHYPQEENGIDFWWLDWQQKGGSSVPGLDTLWMLNHLHFLDSGKNGKMPLTFSRYAGVGSHRYPIGFSGDTVTTWDSLDFQPYFTATASNVGYSWWSHDIGGHMRGIREEELSLRWLQLGIFSPIMRLHSTCNEFYGKEPWKYNLEIEKIMTSFLQLRHRLIPYLYTMNYKTHLEGLPLVQPMYYHHEEDAAYEVPNEFYFGTEMIVCPITKPVDRRTMLADFDAWLPEGTYIDFFTGQVYKGDRKITLYRDMDTIPVLVKAGGIIPMAKDYKMCHQENPENLEVLVCNGADGSFDLYEDMGEKDTQKPPVITHFEFKAGKTAKLLIQVEGEMEGIIPENRSYEVCFKGVDAPENILVSSNGTVEYAAKYDAEKKELRVCFDGKKQRNFAIELQLQSDQVMGPDRDQALYEILYRAQIEYDLKESVYNMICAEKDDIRLLGKLQQMNLERNLAGALFEQIVSDK
ncbi:MAG: alpha-xylosidase [Ruminococcus sp.]|nr:alpha-xylosidase [Ruminococcus sp.]